MKYLSSLIKLSKLKPFDYLTLENLIQNYRVGPGMPLG